MFDPVNVGMLNAPALYPGINPVEGARIEELDPRQRDERRSLVQEKDRADISPEARRLLERDKVERDPRLGTKDEGRGGQQGGSSEQNELSEDEQREVDELKARDREVRAHEQAHKSVLGAFGGPIQYDYESGPDNKRYAVGGHVSVDMSEVPDDPEATLRKMETIQRAAVAPAEPSAQDQRVRAQAAQIAQQARMDMRTEAPTSGVESSFGIFGEKDPRLAKALSAFSSVEAPQTGQRLDRVA